MVDCMAQTLSQMMAAADRLMLVPLVTGKVVFRGCGQPQLAEEVN